MIAGALFGVAFNALRANKLRSGLTFIGIVFGVTSVMTIISALEGMQDQLEEVFASMGPSTFMVGKMMTVMSDEEFFEKVKRKPIMLEDAELVEESWTLCEKVSPRLFRRSNLKYGNQTLRRVDVMGGTANFIDIVDFEVAQGRFHSAEEDLHKSHVVLIGDMIREEFFEGLDPIGKTIKVDGRKFRVTGVARKRGSMFGESQDDFIVIPLSTYVSHYGQSRRGGVYLTIKAVSVDKLDEAMDQTRMILRAKRKVPYDKPDDFDLMTADAILDMLNQFTMMFRLVLVGISSISLVVGGIVVMNIMMVSVTERTREIGIRKSIGAKQKHVLLQFLFESVMVTLSGGIIGIILGFIAARTLVAMIDMAIDPSAVAITAGLVISVGIGLIFGIYPAMRAARLDPVKALSYE
ncbi:MAG: ABC transporter permease [Candidatus Zixiibacteriota bacterium]|nr:MAG: ABC transporter permease [candidate division Zixibacteria bacterium]